MFGIDPSTMVYAGIIIISLLAGSLLDRRVARKREHQVKQQNKAEIEVSGSNAGSTPSNG